MTLEERKAQAVKEILLLLDLYGKAEENITEELKRSGKYKIGLDSNSMSYATLNKEFNKRFAEIFVKYDLPTDTKLKLW